MDAASWLDRFFPDVPPDPWMQAGCWVGYMKTRSPEHNPPIYWLGRALDAVAEGGASEAIAARLQRAHGRGPCDGSGEADERVQDVLSEACGFAWAAAHLGPPQFRLQHEDPAAPALIAVPAHDACLAPRRLWPVQTMQDLLQLVARHTRDAAGDLPPVTGRIVYIDIYLNPRMYAQDVGYRAELTEPVRAALKHFAAEYRLGHVLTRPFQWGNALQAEY